MRGLRGRAIALGLTLLGSFLILGFLGREVYRQADVASLEGTDDL